MYILSMMKAKNSEGTIKADLTGIQVNLVYWSTYMGRFPQDGNLPVFWEFFEKFSNELLRHLTL